MDCVDGKITEQRALQKGAINANVIDITQNLYLKPNKHFKLLAKNEFAKISIRFI